MFHVEHIRKQARTLPSRPCLKHAQDKQQKAQNDSMCKTRTNTTFRTNYVFSTPQTKRQWIHENQDQMFHVEHFRKQTRTLSLASVSKTHSRHAAKGT